MTRSRKRGLCLSTDLPPWTYYLGRLTPDLGPGIVDLILADDSVIIREGLTRLLTTAGTRSAPL